MPGLTISEWGVLVGILAFFGATSRYLYGWWQRRKVRFTVKPSLTEAANGNFWYASLTVINDSPSPVKWQEWQLQEMQPSGPVVMEQTGLPMTVEPYESRSLVLVMDQHWFALKAVTVKVNGRILKAPKRDLREIEVCAKKDWGERNEK